MKPLIKDTISHIEQAETMAQLREAMEPFLADAGFTWFICSLAETFGLKADAVVALSNLPTEVLATFSKVDFYLTDPRLILARKTEEPFIWSQKVNPRFLEPEVQKIYARSTEWGTGDGLTVPVWHEDCRGSVMYSTDGSSIPDVDLSLMALVSYALHERVVQLFDPLSIARHFPTLTDIEIDLLRLAAEGLSSEGIGERMGMTKRRVDSAFVPIVSKLGAKSRIHAIIRAYRLNFLSPFRTGENPRDGKLVALEEPSPVCHLYFEKSLPSCSFVLEPQTGAAILALYDRVSTAPISDTGVVRCALEQTSGLFIEEVSRLDGCDETIHVMTSPGTMREMPGMAVRGQLKAVLRYVGGEEMPPSRSLDLRMVARALSNAYSFAARQLEAATLELPFNPVEIDVLKWTAVGKTSSETAGILGMTKRSVDEYQAVLSRKLGAQSRAHAVVRAISLGVIGR